MSSSNSETIDWRGRAEQAERALVLQQLESERDLACAQRDVLQARVAALETANESIRGRNEYLENRDRIKVEHGQCYGGLSSRKPLANLLQHSLNRLLSLFKTTFRIADIKSSMSGASRRKRVLDTTQLSNNDNHAEHLSTDPTCLKLQNELQGYVRQEAIKDHLHFMKLEDGKDDPEVNINTTALREVKIEAAHVAMAKIEQRSNGAVTLLWPAVTTTIAELATSSIFKAGIAFGSQNENRVRLAVDIIESRYPALQMWPPTSPVVKQLLATKIANVAKTSSTRATKRRKSSNDNVTASDSVSAKSLEVVGDGTMTRNHDKAPSIMGSDATTSQVLDCESPNHTASEIGSPSPHSETGLESILAAQHVVIASNVSSTSRHAVLVRSRGTLISKMCRSPSMHQTRREPIIATESEVIH
ncbi:BQ5605_C005g03611 [Microbotryum silenes-dioicae]|uniref:BQ5605_C005g03611 protein n=1 Tax=Microbotryum silenes-dioicae TaxID=796604 RepID=A0A2X0MEJ0_9BASI|nr:BQ5605_C005g03611 [Microbotryum silenes-dioicae]